MVVAAIAVGKCKPATQRDLRPDNAVSAIKILFNGEHVHGSALALGIAMLSPCQFRHHALWIHAARQHMAVIAIAGNHLVAGLDRHLHPDDNRLLTDIEMAKSA